MTVTIGTFEHLCTSEQDCGEEIARVGFSAKKVRKGVWKNEAGRIIRLFPSTDAARAEAVRLGYEVNG